MRLHRYLWIDDGPVRMPDPNGMFPTELEPELLAYLRMRGYEFRTKDHGFPYLKTRDVLYPVLPPGQLRALFWTGLRYVILEYRR